MLLLPAARRSLPVASLGSSLEGRHSHPHLVARSDRVAARLGDLAQLARFVSGLLKRQLGNGAEPYITPSSVDLHTEHPRLRGCLRDEQVQPLTRRVPPWLCVLHARSR